MNLMEILYPIGTLVALIVCIYCFIRGFNVLKKMETQEWQSKWEVQLKELAQR